MKKTAIVFEPLHGYTESYIVRYWDKSEEYAKQRVVTVYAKSKDRHAQAAETVKRAFKGDIISVIYQ
jgi:hypothetical protein